jgi:hypothetical protein
MANLALIRGAAAAAPKFTDIRAAVEPGIRRFENIMSLKQKEKEEDERQREREDAIKFNLYANLPGLEDDIVPDNFKKDATQAALNIRAKQRELINNKNNMDQYEFIDQLQSYNKQINSMNKDFAAYKEWSANWVDLKDSDDLSSGMSAKDRKTILDLVTGQAKPIYTDEGFAYQTEEGEIHYLKNLPKPIPIAHDKHLAIFDEMSKIGETFGKVGIGNDDPSYTNRKIAALSNFKRGLSKEDALSLGADFLKVGGLSGEYAGLLKEIAENPALIEETEFDDRDEFGKVIGTIKGIEGYKEFITDQYGQVADNMNKTLKDKYDAAMKVKATTSTRGGLTAGQQLKEMKERQEYSDRVTLAAQDLSKVDFKNINSISTAAGGKVVSFAPNEKDNPHPGGNTIIINDKIVIPEDMTDAEKIRKIIEARVQNKMLEQSDVPNLLMSLKITGEEMVIAPPTPSELLAKYSTQNKQ